MKGRKRGEKEGKKEKKRKKKKSKIKVWSAKEGKWKAKKLFCRFLEAFQIGHEKAFKIHGTIYISVCNR